MNSSPPPTITLEQAKSDPVINIDSDSESETEKVEPYSCCTCKYVKDDCNHSEMVSSLIFFIPFFSESYVSIGNSLVECLECHSMYHQNCHNPPIIDINLNDPRIVWYCINCRQKDSQKTVSIIVSCLNSGLSRINFFLLHIKDSRSSGKESKKSSSKNSGSKAEKLSNSKNSQGKFHKYL